MSCSESLFRRRSADPNVWPLVLSPAREKVCASAVRVSSLPRTGCAADYARQSLGRAVVAHCPCFVRRAAFAHGRDPTA